MLLDLEKQRVIDLLPERSAQSLAEWLRAHPGTELIARDRSGMYADGGRQGAPAAVQVTDRYHLVSNLGEALTRDVQRLQAAARAARQKVAEKAVRKPTLIETRRRVRRTARYQRWAEVVELARQGYSQRAIADRCGLARNTVGRWLQEPGYPERPMRSDRRRDEKLKSGRPEAGLAGTLSRTRYSARWIASLLIQFPRQLSAEQRRHLADFLKFCPEARRLRYLALQFEGCCDGGPEAIGWSHG